MTYFAAEDPEQILVRRIHEIGKHLSSAAKKTIAARLDLHSIAGLGLNLMIEKRVDRVTKKCVGARLLVFDTISRAHCLDKNMTRLIGQMETIALRTGAVISFLHHVAKAAARDGTGADQHAAPLC